MRNEPHRLAAALVWAWAGEPHPVPAVRRCLRAYIDKESVMAWLAAAISALTFVYLFAALIRPEWF
ncbi:potassium-transporting ATPase subunit F [Paraburkholderia silviterrae]|uniref:Potassium-transporting ATPase subunit F n=1 Tax=Paraburkholderia silviterrae TaxID=2528715 RepID=A0A4R5LYV8_9BURK|nr:potassium-transporting ATPase subunit F [Paraburkholderia silviterrae]